MRAHAKTIGTVTSLLLTLVAAGCGQPGDETSVDEVSSAVDTNNPQVNCGGPTVGSFTADSNFVGGSTISHPEVTIDTNGINVPASVFQTAHVGNFTYTFSGYPANQGGILRLYFAETFFTAAGSRAFNVIVGGTQVLTAFDILAQRNMVKGRALEKDFGITANAQGTFTVQFTSVANKNQPLLSGLSLAFFKTST